MNISDLIRYGDLPFGVFRQDNGEFVKLEDLQGFYHIDEITAALDKAGIKLVSTRSKFLEELEK